MLARQHANLGVIGMIGSAYGLTAIGNAHLSFLDEQINADLISLTSPTTLLIFVIIGSAFALVPDLDHPGSTVSRKFGILSQGASHLFGAVTGGHREASHSLLFSIICGLLGVGITLIPFRIGLTDTVSIDSAQFFTGILFVMSVIFIIKLILPLGIGKRYYTVLVLAAIVIASAFAIGDLIPSFGLGLAMFLGVNMHILGDSATPSKVKYLWPSRRKFGINFNGKTGQERELYVIQPLFILGASALIIGTIIIPGFNQLSVAANQAVTYL